MKKAALLLGLGIFLTVSCAEIKIESQVSDVHFTPCQQNELRSSSEFSSEVEVTFIDNGVQIMYRNFEVTCDFSDVSVTHTFVNGFLGSVAKPCV